MQNLKWHFEGLVQRILIICFPSCLIIMRYHNTSTIPPLYSCLLQYTIYPCQPHFSRKIKIYHLALVWVVKVSTSARLRRQLAISPWFLHCNYKISLNRNHLWLVSEIRTAYISLTYILACIWCFFELRFAVTRMCNRFISALILMHNNEVGARKQFYSNWAIKQPPVPNSSPPRLRHFQK